MDDLDVDGELAAVVGKDKDTDAATACVESPGNLLPKVALVEDRQALLDLTRLSHAGKVAVSHVKDTVLLEDGAEHGLDDNAGRGVGDERGLLVQLLGEEVNTEVTVLARSRGGGNADNLAGAALKDQDIAIADVVARDSDGVGDASGAGRARRGGGLTDHLHIMVVDVVVVVGEDLVCHFVQSVTKRVIVSCCSD